MSITAGSKTWMMNIIASASAGVGGSASIAGAIGVLLDEAVTRARVGAGSAIRAGDNVTVAARADSTELNVNVAAAFCGSGTGVGLSVFYNGLDRTVEAIVGDGTALSAGRGSIDVHAIAEEWTLIVAACLDVSTKLAVSGVNAITRSESAVRATVGKGCLLTAGDSIAVSADMDIKSYQVSGGVTLSLSSAGIGESAAVMLMSNTVQSVIDSAASSVTKLTAHGAGSGNRTVRRRGIYVGATARESILLVAVSGNAAAGSAAVTGVASALKEQNRVTARVCEGAELRAEAQTVSAGEDSSDVTVEADDASSIINIAGGLGLSMSVTVGASALVTLFEKTVTADVSQAAVMEAAGSVRILAGARDDMYLIVAGASASTSVDIAATAAVLKYENRVTAAGARRMDAKAGDIIIKASTEELIYNIAVAVALSASVAVNGTAVLTFIDCVTEAGVGDGAALTAGGNISILATSREQISSDVAGGSGSSVAIGGALDYIRTKLSTRAYTGRDVQLTAVGDVTVEATDDYLLLGVSALVSGGLSVSVGVAVLASFHYNTVSAELGQSNIVSGNNISVHAYEKRDFQSLSFSLALGGTAAIGASAAVMITGGNLPADISNKILGRETIKDKTYDVFKTSSGGKLLIPDYSEVIGGTPYAVFETGEMRDVFIELDGVSYQIYENEQRLYYDAATGKYYAEDPDSRVMVKADGAAAVTGGVSYGGSTYQPVMSDVEGSVSKQVSETIKGESYALYNTAIDKRETIDSKEYALYTSDNGETLYGRNGEYFVKNPDNSLTRVTPGTDADGELSYDDRTYRAALEIKYLYGLGSEYYTVSTDRSSSLVEVAATRDGSGRVSYNGAEYSAAQENTPVKVYYDSASDAYYTRDSAGALIARGTDGLPADVYSSGSEVCDSGNSDTLYYDRANNKYYLRRYGSETLTEVAVTVNSNGTVTCGGKSFMRGALDPQTQADSVTRRCASAANGMLAGALGSVADVNDALTPDDLDVSKSGQSLYNGVVDKDGLQNNIKANSENPITDSGRNTDLALSGANSRVGSLRDATSARVGRDSRVTARGDIAVRAHDTLLCLALSGAVGAAGTAAVGVGASAVKLMSDVQATVEEGTQLSAAGDIIVRASTGATEKEFADTKQFCPVTNTLGKQKQANATMGNIRAALEKAGLIDSSDKKASIWVVSLVPTGAGAVGVGVAAGILIYYSNASASLAGAVTGARALTVETSVDYPELLVAVASLGGAGVVGVGVSAAVIYLKGTALAEITGSARVTGVSSAISVRTVGGSRVRSAAVAVAFSGTAAVPVNAVVTINKNQLVSRICAGAAVNAPSAALTVGTDYTLGMEALLVAVGVSFVSVAVDVLVVLGDVKASAYIGGSGADTEVTAGSVSVGSSVKPRGGALLKAWIVNVSAGLVGIAATAAVAINKIENEAAIRNTKLSASGDASVTAQLQGVVSVNLVSAAGGLAAIPLAVAYSYIRSANRAIVETNKDISAAQLSITAGPSSASAEAMLVAGSAALFQLKLFIAVVENNAVNEARLSAGGRVRLTGGLTVLSNGTASSDARCNTAAEITGVSISAVMAASISKGSYSARLELLSGAELSAAGAVKVSSLYEAGKAYAENAPKGAMPLKLSLTDLGVTVTVARSRVGNTAAVTGSGTLKAAALEVEARLKSGAKAVNAKFAVDLSIIKVTLSGASAYIADSNSAMTGSAGDALTVSVTGKTAINADSAAECSAESMTPLAIGLLNFEYGSVDCRIVNDVWAGIGENTRLTASDIAVAAASSGSAIARMYEGWKLSLINVSKSLVGTKQENTVKAMVGKNTVLSAADGAIRVSAYDHAKGDAAVDARSIGALVSADFKYSENALTQNISAEIGQGARLTAKANVEVVSNADAELSSNTSADKYGLFAGGTVQAKNSLTRGISAAVMKNAVLESRYGDVRVIAQCGGKDNIITTANGRSGGLIGIGGLTSQCNVTTNVTTTVAHGADILAVFGRALIAAYCSEAKLKTSGSYSFKGFGAGPTSRAYINNLNMSMRVDVAAEQTSATNDDGEIRASSVSIETNIPAMDIIAKSDTDTHMAGGSSYAYSVVTLFITGAIRLGAAAISAYRDLAVLASANPQASSPAVTAIAEAYTGAAVAFMTKAQAFLEGKSVTTVTLSAGTWLVGADVDVRTSKFMATPNLRASARKAFIGRVREETHNHFDSAGNITETITAGGASFHIGGAAAGIVLEYCMDENGRVREYAVGLPGKNGTYAVLTREGEINLSSAVIGNVLPGSLSIKADLSGSRIYGQKHIDSITIINRTASTLVLGQLRPFKSAFARSTVERASRFSEEYMFVSPTEHPVITVTSTGGGDVVAGGWINNENGSLRIEWQGAAGSLSASGSVYLEALRVAPIWVHQLQVINAKNLSGANAKGGADLSAAAEIYLSVYKTGSGGTASYEDPSLSVTASGAVNLKLTLAEIKAWDYKELPEGSDMDLIGGTLDLGGISAGALDITCGTPFRVYYLSRAEQARIIIPGVVEFMSDYKHYDTAESSKVSLTVDEIARYFIGQSHISTGGIDASSGKAINLNRYALPNGLTVYLVADDNAREFGYEKNELYRVVSSESSGVSFDTSRYILKTDRDGSVYVILRDYHNATLELATGKLTIGDDSIDVYVDYGPNGWLISDTAQIREEVCYEYYILKYKRTESGAYDYGPDGRLQPVYDSSGKQEMESIVLSGTPSFVSGGYAYYELYYEYGWKLLTGSDWRAANTYFARFKEHSDSDMGVFDGIYAIENSTLWYNTRYTKDHGYNPEGVEQYINNFMGIYGLEAWFGFHRASNSHKRLTYEWVTMKYNGAIIVNRQAKEVASGVVQRVERLVNTDSSGGYEYYYYLNWNGLAADYYWDFSMDGGGGSNECTHVYWYRQRTITGDSFSTSEPGGSGLGKVSSYVQPVSSNKTEYKNGKQYYHYYSYGGSYGSNSSSGNTVLYDPLHYRTFYAAANLYYMSQDVQSTMKYKVFFASDHGYGEFGSGVNYSQIDTNGYRNGYDWGGYVHISKEEDPNAAIYLWYETDPASGVRRYRIGRDLWLGSDKLVYQTDYQGMKNGKNLYELTTYNLDTGDLELIDREGEANGPHTDTLRFQYGHNVGGKTPYMIVGGDVHYERLAEGEKPAGGNRPIIAANIFGAYFYHDGAKWFELPIIDAKGRGGDGEESALFGSDGSRGWRYEDFVARTLDGANLVQNGCYKTNDGVELYFGGNLVFKVGVITKTENGRKITKTVHSMYYLKNGEQKNVLRYSVDQDGVVYWSESAINKRGGDLFHFGGREEPGHVSYMGLPLSENMSLKVEAGAALAVLPAAIDPDLILKSLILCPKDLENSARRIGGRQIPIPAGRLSIPGGTIFNNISIGSASIASDLELTATGSISVKNKLSVQDAELSLRAGKSASIGSLDEKNARVTIVTDNAVDGKLSVGDISAESSALTLRAENDSLSVGNVTGRDADIELSGETGLTAGSIEASHGTLTMLSTGKIKAGEVRADSLGSRYPGKSAVIDGSSVELDRLSVNYPTDLYAQVNGTDGVTIGQVTAANGSVSLTGGKMTLGEMSADFGNISIDNRGETTIEKLTASATANVFISSTGAVGVGELKAAGPTVRISSGDTVGGFDDVVIRSSELTGCGELSLTGRNVSLQNNTGDIKKLSIDARGDLVLAGSGGAAFSDMRAAGGVSVDIGGALTAINGADVIAGRGASISCGGDAALGDVIAHGGDVSISSGGKTTVRAVKSDTGKVSVSSVGDVELTKVEAAGSVSIRSAMGGVRDTVVSDADRRIQETLDAQRTADYAHFMVQSAVEKQEKLEAEKARAKTELGEVNARLDELKKEKDPDKKELERLNEQLDVLTERIRLLDDEIDVTKQAYNGFVEEYEDKQELLNQAKQRLKAALAAAGPTIKAGAGISIAAGGDIGSADNPITLKTPGDVELTSTQALYGGSADINVFADGELKLAGVSGANVSLGSTGSVSSGSMLDVPVDGGTVEITALDGDVGSREHPLNMSGAGLITVSGNNVYMRSEDVLRLGGMVSAHGDKPEAAPAGGTLYLWTYKNIEMLSGTSLVFKTLITREERRPDPDRPAAQTPFRWRELYDEPSGVTVAGYLSEDAELRARVCGVTGDGRPDVAFDPRCGACGAVLGAWSLQSRIAAYGIEVSGERAGKLVITLEVDGVAEGTVISVLCCVDGRLTRMSCRVKNGCISFLADGREIYCVLLGSAAELEEYCKSLSVASAAVL